MKYIAFFLALLLVLPSVWGAYVPYYAFYTRDGVVSIDSHSINGTKLNWSDLLNVPSFTSGGNTTQEMITAVNTTKYLINWSTVIGSGSGNTTQEIRQAINNSVLNGSNFFNISCSNIIGGSDSNYCSDSTGAGGGGNTTEEMITAVNTTKLLINWSTATALTYATITQLSNLALNVSSINTSLNIKLLGFNITTELKNYFDTLYYSILNPLQFINSSYGNLTYGKLATLQQLSANVTSINLTVNALLTSNTTQATAITNLQTDNTTQATAIANLVTSNTTQATAITNLQTDNTTQANLIITVNNSAVKNSTSANLTGLYVGLFFFNGTDGSVFWNGSRRITFNTTCTILQSNNSVTKANICD